MKYTCFSPRFLLVALSAAAALLSPIMAQAQETWEGGVGSNPTIWDADNTSDWSVGQWTETPQQAGSVFYAQGPNAEFTDSTASSTVTVDDATTGIPVYVGDMIFNLPGSISIEPNTPTDAIYENASASDNPELINVASGNVTIDAPIVVSDFGVGNEQGFVNVGGTSNLNLGNIDFASYILNPNLTKDRRLQIQNFGSGTVTLTGTYTTSGTTAGGGSLVFGANGSGTYTLASTADFTNFNTGLGATAENNAFVLDGNTLNIATSKFDGNQTLALQNADAHSTVNIVGAQKIVLNIYDSMKYSGTASEIDPDGVNPNGVATFNQSTADQSSWAGTFTMDGSSLGLNATGGGRLNWNSTITNGDAPKGIVINATADSTGVVVLSNGYTYAEYDGNGIVQPSSVLSGDIQHGTALVTNTSGSAFGSSALPVNLEAGATLGGNGIITQQIVAVGATSRIAAGDKGQSNLGIAASIGTLHLTGGIQATSGLTMDFKLTTPGASDALDLGAGAFTLSGVVTVNLTAFDGTFAPGTGETFVLATGTGTWNDDGATFNFTPPAGDSVTSYSFNTTTDQFTVTVVAPEPSTWAMMLAGVVFLVGFTQRRLRRS